MQIRSWPHPGCAGFLEIWPCRRQTSEGLFRRGMAGLFWGEGTVKAKTSEASHRERSQLQGAWALCAPNVFPLGSALAVRGIRQLALKACSYSGSPLPQGREGRRLCEDSIQSWRSWLLLHKHRSSSLQRWCSRHGSDFPWAALGKNCWHADTARYPGPKAFMPIHPQCVMYTSESRASMM